MEPMEKSRLSESLEERDRLLKHKQLLSAIPLGTKVVDVRNALKQAGWKLFEWDGSITSDPKCVWTINAHPPGAEWMAAWAFNRDGQLIDVFTVGTTEKPNKAPEPTPGAVTPRATEGVSK